ncbi:hypothetical protein L228DRAFT_263436 [Xylona heveae TC161]|uniref:Uncharacterized protein n=1 Tax=Xylona heveae (strain CBS 132557 / TC161) TaxID=1328760 RepID=A0A164ZUW9_XYLHT|nr:hypothetical protein L228DRAFT_263436 [Xylona heveae TC161]KZF19562.1 hypothetical protein L228DRAFT_263436 [Xylona heveae TC161]
MNTVKSFWLGWGSLCVAGGVAYVFAKRSINEDRAARHDAYLKRQRLISDLEKDTTSPSPSTARSYDTAGSPSQEASSDPAPTRHEAENEGQRVLEKSKYETTEPFRSRKGDRFS